MAPGRQRLRKEAVTDPEWLSFFGSNRAMRRKPSQTSLSVYKALGPPFCGFVIRAVAQVYSAGDVAVLPDLKSPVSVLPHRTAPANLDFAL
jgi:hypothetical protein